MARSARMKSKTGIYHVMLRGIDKRNIFLAGEEYVAFLKYLKKAQYGKGTLCLTCGMLTPGRPVM